MKRIIFLMISILLIFIHFKDETIEIKEEYYVTCVRSDGNVEKIELEEYIVGVVSAEMPTSFELEALKAQAVASRTFVLSRNLMVDDSTASQVYIDEIQRENRGIDETKVREAVNQTKGQVLTYNDYYISALFFSSSNGKTENNEDYFNSNALPYLRSVSSVYETPIVDYKIIALENYFSSSELEILSYTQGGNVHEVKIGDTIYSGREIREKLGLNSSSFDVRKVDGGYSFTTYGYGHGVGMSQYGANGMAQNGYTYDEILKHYYQGVCIKQLK